MFIVTEYAALTDKSFAINVTMEYVYRFVINVTTYYTFKSDSFTLNLRSLKT